MYSYTLTFREEADKLTDPNTRSACKARHRPVISSFSPMAVAIR